MRDLIYEPLQYVTMVGIVAKSTSMAVNRLIG
jgi:hypothetical protein